MGIQFLLFFWTKRINSLDRTTEKCSWHFDPFSISLFKIVVINEKYSIHESLNTQLTFCIIGFLLENFILHLNKPITNLRLDLDCWLAGSDGRTLNDARHVLVICHSSRLPKCEEVSRHTFNGRIG